MKTFLLLLLFTIVLLTVGYFGLPLMIEKQTGSLRSDVLFLKQSVQKMEEESKLPLPPEADAGRIIKTVNTLSYKMSTLEESFHKNASATDETLKKQMTATEEELKKQADAIDKDRKEILVQLEKIRFANSLEDIRGRILKVKLDLVSRNIGTAKNEIGLVNETLERMKASVSEENRKMIEDFQGILKKARTEIDVDLPSASSRIELLWHELGKPLGKG